MRFKMRFYRKIYLGIFWTLLVISFIFFASLLLLKARGWQLNYHTWKLLKTGMIYLAGVPETVEVKVNGQFKADSLPLRLSNLTPGYYEIQISAPGYQAWKKTIQVLPEMAVIENDIILFLAEPKDAVVPQDLTAEIIKQKTAKQNLAIRGTEIFWQEKLLTRMSENVLTAEIYPDQQHLVFQVGSEIRAIELDGTNNQLLFKLLSDEPAVLAFDKNGFTCYYTDYGKIFAKTIR